MTLALLLSALVIFLLRLADVSLGTLRIAMLVRGHRSLAGALSFLESLVWLVAAAQVLSNLDSPIKFVAYAGGYAAGTMLGATVERWLAIGDTLMRIVSPIGAPSAVEELRKAGYYATVLNAEGRDGEVRVSFTVVPRRRVPEVLEIVKRTNPDAYVTFENTNPIRLSAQSPSRVRK